MHSKMVPKEKIDKLDFIKIKRNSFWNKLLKESKGKPQTRRKYL